MKFSSKNKLYKKAGYLLLEKNFQFSAIFPFLSRYRYFFLLVLLYGLIRFINLTILPIFNDESIYLRWGWLEIQSKNWFISLYDGKQPLLTWFFGYAQIFFSDPLYAGRFVSIITGLITLIGIFKIGMKFFTERFALLAGLFYSIVSIFVFYDRMALMESSITAIGIWSCYFFLSLVAKPVIQTAILLGVTFGIGLFDKSDAGIFLVTAIISGSIVGLTRKHWNERKYFFLMLSLSLFVCVIVLAPLLLQKEVYTIVYDNSRYAYTLPQIFSHFFPIIAKNIPATFFLLWGYLTPVPFLLSIAGIIFFLTSQDLYAKLLVAWFFLPIIFFILFTTNPIDRYIVAFLPVTTFFCAKTLLVCMQRFDKAAYRISLFFAAFFIPVLLTCSLLFAPVTYFSLLHFLTPAVDVGYTQAPSGYGIPEIRKYLLQHSQNKKIALFVQIGSGNPEDALYDYFGEKYNPNITVISTSKELACKQPQIFLMTSYFISEGDSVNSSCMKNIKKFYRPVGNTFVGIYRIEHKAM